MHRSFNKDAPASRPVQRSGAISSRVVSIMALIGIVVAIIFGFFFYVMRCRWQLAYGVFELLVSSAVIFLTFYPQSSYLLLQEFSWQGWFFSKGVGALAGIYVMVRGLDNVEKGLPPKLQDQWKRVFHGIPK
jgi:hypothetical protein